MPSVTAPASLLAVAIAFARAVASTVTTLQVVGHPMLCHRSLRGCEHIDRRGDGGHDFGVCGVQNLP